MNYIRDARRLTLGFGDFPPVIKSEIDLREKIIVCTRKAQVHGKVPIAVQVRCSIAFQKIRGLTDSQVPVDYRAGLRPAVGHLSGGKRRESKSGNETG